MESSSKELVNDNIRLVYYMFNKLQKTDITRRYSDDLISEGMLGLVKAANSFDENRGIKFATYASRCIQNQMLMYIRKLKRFCIAEVSLYQPFNIDSENNELYYSDILELKEIPQDTMLAAIDFNEFIKKHKQRDKKIFISYCKGYNQNEIAQKLGLSQSYISRIIKNLRKDYKKVLG